ncbi:hypothetical protein [Rhodovulum sp.]|uniref:hypothetical protein n=1 Tax=Rhodovulum sp. TaxID=34009 RepID=UPI0017D24749|nr:hypothetical protein [Rhodovulum sp.]HDR28772.1 hypothetical protein [Rhodovulum sp.]
MKRAFRPVLLLLACLAPAIAAADGGGPVRLSDAEHQPWRAIGRINVTGLDTGGMTIAGC